MELSDSAKQTFNSHLTTKNIKCGSCSHYKFNIAPNLYSSFMVAQLENRPDFNLKDLENIKGLQFVVIECQNCFSLTQFSLRSLGLTDSILRQL